MHINGKCHCGQISFTAEIDATRVVLCHCADCQILSGSPFRIVAEAPAGTLKIHGAPKSYVFIQHGRHMEQIFCPACGTPLYAMAQEDPTSVVVRLGCVEQRAQLKPAMQIWQEFAMPWLAELAAVPASPELQGSPK